jgi:Flp pilus assembly protein TadG
LLLIFLIIEGGLYFQARNTAQSAAREGVSYLRLAGNNSDAGAFVAGAERVSQRYAAEIGRLDGVTAVGSVDRSSGRVDMVVVGEVVLPLGGTVEVSQTATATLEQFRGDTRDGSGP